MIKNYLKTFLKTFLLLTTVFSGTLFADTPVITIYDYSNYGGDSITLAVGDYNYNDFVLYYKTGSGNYGVPVRVSEDVISSVKVPAGLKVTLYEHRDFGGAYHTYTEDTPSLGDFDNRTSSLKVEYVEARPPVVSIFEHENYGGESLTLSEGEYSHYEDFKFYWADTGGMAPGLVANDVVSSVRVPTGYKITLYEDTNFGGQWRTYYENTPILVDFYGNGNFGNTTSSIKIEKVTAPTWTPGATLSDYNTDDGKANLISNYAPRVWLATKDGELEPYKPSSVDWAFERFDRYKNEDGRYWLAAKDKYELNNSPDTYEFFRGNFTTCPPPPVYSFLVERGNGYVDVIYYMFYPFNRGKSISILGSDGTYYGNHVGDWEHITVRFKKEANGYYPFEVYVSAHDFGGAYAWSEMNKVLVSGTLTHPIVYAAWGSHGLWKDSGNHNYKSINYGVGSVDLTDICNDGQAWDTWYNTVRLYYNEKRGIEGSVSASCGTMDSSTWPAWMSTDFTNPGTGDPTVPGNGPIYRWGDTESGCQDILGQCRIENGPTGPSAKDVWFTETASTSTINPAPAAASWGSGRLDIFVKGSNGDLSHKGYDGGWWSGWESLGGVLTTAPAVTSWAWGRLDIFVRATDGNLYQKIFDNGWSDWINLGNPGTLGTIDSAPAVASWGSGRLDIFVKGSNGDLLHKGYDGGYDGWWSGWESQGGVLTSAPAVASWGYGRLDVFVKGTDNILYQKYYDGGWSGWIGQ